MINRKVFIVSTYLLLGAFTSNAQDQIGFNLILGDYSMGDMKSLQTEFMEDLRSTGLPFEIVSDFSWSIQAEFNYQTPIGNAFIGPFLNYTVTEGRVHYGDYSGESFTEQNFQRIMFGAIYTSNLTSSIEVYIKGGLSIIQLDLYSETLINGLESVNESIKFTSEGGSLELGIDKRFNINSNFCVLTGVGMELNFLQGKLNAKDIDNAFLINENGNEVKPDFTGIRFRLGIRYNF